MRAIGSHWQLKDKERKSKVEAKEKHKKQREKESKREELGAHKPAGFRWILLEEHIFHSLPISHKKNLPRRELKLSGKTERDFLFPSLGLLSHGQFWWRKKKGGGGEDEKKKSKLCEGNRFPKSGGAPCRPVIWRLVVALGDERRDVRGLRAVY